MFSCENEDLDEISSKANNTANIAPLSSLYYDGIYEIRDGKEVDLTLQQYLSRSTQEFYEIASLNPAYTYLGSVLQAESINTGEYRSVAYPNALKPEIRIAFSLPIKSRVIKPKFTSFNDAVIDAITDADKDFSGKQSQVFSYKMKEFNYYKEVNMAFGANIKIGQLFSITTSVESDKKQSNTALFVDFSQIYFNVAMDIPDDGNIFLNETERQKYLNQKPVYVNSVNMGRKGVMIVESEESYSEISVSIRAAFNAGIVNGELSLDSKTKEMLKRAQIYIYIIGGNGEDAAKVVTGFPAFQDFIIKGGVYSKEIYDAEANIASKLILLDSTQNIKRIDSFDSELEKIEKAGNINLSTKQEEAIQAINSNNVVIITGGPGTGKTTIIKNVIDIYKSHGKKVVLCAPTGRAAKRMTEMTGEEAKTLHRLLEIGKIEKVNEFTIMNYEVAPIDADVIIVDEASMVDIYLMNYLLNGIYQGTKLILVGDTDQLPSVGPGSVLKDIINSERIKTIFLDEIFRQAAQSKIIVNSHKVNDGEYFLEKEEQEGLKDDFFYIKEKSQDIMLDQIISLCKGRLKNFGDYDFFENIQILSPTKKGLLGTKELNKRLQEELNPSNDEKKEKKVGEVIFREGDRVMQVKNNYDIYWEKGNTRSLTYENGTGIFNGELGKILKIDFLNKQIKILFDDEKEAWYAFSDMDQIEHAYAITVHKAQGSEFDVVIMVVTQSSAMLLTRNLLYTGLTRAKKLLILIGNDNVVKFMIQNADTKIRNTGLEYKLKMIS
mgnify:CR=1 FL=1